MSIMVGIAMVGFFLTAYIVYRGMLQPEYKKTIEAPIQSAYMHTIACQGIIESRYKNISIGSSFSDIVTDIYVVVGQQVKKGDALFMTDTRTFLAQYNESIKERDVAEKDYLLQSTLFAYYQNLTDKSAVSQQAYTQAEYNTILALKRLEKADAACKIIATYIERSVVYAPCDGQVLQLNIRPGQYAQQTSIDNMPLILFGDTSSFHLRIDIDEEDAWRFTPRARGYACIRGNNRLKIPLDYVYTEPYIIPKKSLTGYDQERTDTRVLQVVYLLHKDTFPIYAGQLLDVYLEGEFHEASS